MKCKKQTGAALAVSLVMLGVLTLLGVAAMGLGTTELRVVGNLQARKAVETAVQNAIEQFVSTPTPFNRSSTCDPEPQTVVVDGIEISVDLDEPICHRQSEVEGYSAAFSLSPETTEWEIRATGRMTQASANTITHQGLSIVLAAGHCPATPSHAPCS
jgi:hypothetical protein